MFLFHQLAQLIVEGFRQKDWLTLRLVDLLRGGAAIQPQFLILIRLTGPNQLPRNQRKLFSLSSANPQNRILWNFLVVDFVARNFYRPRNFNFPTSQLGGAIMESTSPAQIDGNNWMLLKVFRPRAVLLSWINIAGNRQEPKFFPCASFKLLIEAQKLNAKK